MKKEMRVFLIDPEERNTTISELRTLDNDTFMDLAEEDGTVYGLDGFQADWNSGMISQFTCIRFIEVQF